MGKTSKRTQTPQQHANAHIHGLTYVRTHSQHVHHSPWDPGLTGPSLIIPPTTIHLPRSKGIYNSAIGHGGQTLQPCEAAAHCACCCISKRRADAACRISVQCRQPWASHEQFGSLSQQSRLTLSPGPCPAHALSAHDDAPSEGSQTFLAKGRGRVCRG